MSNEELSSPNIVGCVMSTAKPRELTLTNRLAAIDANISNAQHPDDTGNQASTLVLQISLASIREIDCLMGDLKDLRAKIEDRCGRIQDDIVEFAELSRSAVQLTKIVSDSVTQVERKSSSSNSSSIGETTDLAVPIAATQ
jgi:hypothetical protein